MEELLACALLLGAGIIAEDTYQSKLADLFLSDPENDLFLRLEWVSNLSEAVALIKEQTDFDVFCAPAFGKVLMKGIADYYNKCMDMQEFGSKMYSLWQNLPGHICL